MMNTNKILTVSYGTFSCTLEGFEDSFGTMKVIAEYFRDLAADDRYFGAEPPQPDADMLARIAQKEVARKVEAREQDGKIVLSALEGTVAPAAAVAAAASYAAIPDAVVEDAPQPEEAPRAEETQPQEDAQTQDVASEEHAIEDEITLDEVPVESETISVIETGDLSATNEPNEAISMDLAEEQIEEDAAEPEHQVLDTIADLDIAADASETVSMTDVAAGFEVESADITAEDTFAENEMDIVPGQPDAEVSAFFAASPTETTEAVEFEATDVDAMDAPAPDSIAAKLQRIRAVVSSNEEGDADEDYIEDLEDVSSEAATEEEEQHADAAVAKSETPEAEVTAETPEQTEAEELISDARADIEDALQADEAADQLTEQAEEALDEDADEIDAILDSLDDDKPLDEVMQDELAQDDAVRALDEVSAEDVVTDTTLEDSVDDSVNNLFQAEATAEEPVASAVAPLRTPQVEATQEPAIAETKAARTRVIKVKRVDLEAAIQKGDLQEYNETAQNTPSHAATKAAAEENLKQGLDDLAPAKSAKTTLSADQQNELARELAALEDDIAEEDIARDKTAGASAQKEEVEPAPSSRRILPNLEEPTRSPVSRLLAETDHQMDEPESATRRDAFAHLRAAVAAKKADDSINGNASGEDDDDVYREDLAEAVRPRRTTSRNPHSEPRPAPLKLVAEQRIDSEDTPNAGPVQPRRVAAEATAETAPAATDESGGFADFASEMGASTLPQLLEAAAAYMSFVEGREQFSRPQLMTKVRQAEGQEGFSREDGLRSFGQLLRAGKIEKLKGGRFTVSEDIGYRPDQRAVG